MTQKTSPSPTSAPMLVGKDEGEARWWFGSLAVIKTTAADTGGQLTLVEVTEPPGYEAPLHVHHHDDEGFWVLEGDVTFQIGDMTIEAHEGDYAFGPRDIPHRYTVGDAGCRLLFIMVPGGLEDVLRATSEPAPSRTIPPPPEEPPDIDRLKEIVASHGYELLV